MHTDRLIPAIAAICVLGGASRIEAPMPTQGLYEITYRLELPHLERYALERSARLCVDPRSAQRPLPILGAKSAFAACSMSPVTRDGTERRYSIACAGRAAARATARHRLTPTGYTGRIAITLGAKNMTMVEVQSAYRVADCTN